MMREERLPPIPVEPKLKNLTRRELHDLLQLVREESLAASTRQEQILNRLAENQQVMHDCVVSRPQDTLVPPEQQADSVQRGHSPRGVSKAPRTPSPRREQNKGSDKAGQEHSAAAQKPEATKSLTQEQPAATQQVSGSAQRSCAASKKFECVMGLLIFLNVVMLFVEREKTEYNFAFELELEKDIGFWNGSKSILEGMTRFFNRIFFIELTLRLVTNLNASIRSIAFYFDAFIVLISGVDYTFKIVLSSQGGGGERVYFFRMARMVKLLMLFRLFKAANVFSELRILFKSVLSNMMALAWFFVLLFFIMFFAGLIMAQMAANVIDDEHLDYELRRWIFEHYGSGTRFFYTAFEATVSGGWSNYARKLIKGLGLRYAFFWTLYLVSVVFALMILVSALFLQNTLKIASAGEETMNIEKVKKQEAHISKFKQSLSNSSQDAHGTMDLGAIEKLVARADIAACLANIGLEAHDVIGLFHVLDDGCGEITHVDLLTGMMKLSGGVRALDSDVAQCDMKTVLKNLHSIKRCIAMCLATE